MGVITTEVIPAGKVFGPIPPNLTLTDPALLIGHMTCDNRPDVHTVKLDLTEYSDERRSGEWVPYVQAARDEKEQNLEAFLQDGRLRYRAVRTVGAGEEVLVWYSKELAVVLGLPELQSFHIKDGGVFQCPYCMNTFRYPHSVRAHMRFKCEHRSSVHPVDPIQASVALATREMKEKLLASGFMDYRTGSHLGYPAYPQIPPARLVNSENPHNRLISPDSHYSSRLVSPESHHSSITTLPSPTSSIGSATLSSPGKASPMRERHAETRSSSRSPPLVRTPPGSAKIYEEGMDNRKRHLGEQKDDTEYGLAAKRLATEEMTRKPETFSPREGSRSPESRLSQKRTPSPPSVPSREKHDKYIHMDMNQNVNNVSDEEESISAFRKVEKQHPSLPSLASPPGVPPAAHQHRSPSSGQVAPPFNPASPGSALYNSALAGQTKAAAQYLGKELSPMVAAAAAAMPRYPLIPPAGFPPGLLPPTSFNENIPINLADLYRNPLKLAEMGRSMEKLSDINNIENNNISGKLPAYFGGEPRPLGGPLPFGFYKSPNPMVDKMLTTGVNAGAVAASNFASLSQNWCAKCNATFRMTSDLVYHMRSHHKMHTDPMKKKREDKLKCNICGETFRERHHLTRHMTSHA